MTELIMDKSDKMTKKIMKKMIKMQNFMNKRLILVLLITKWKRQSDKRSKGLK